MRIKFLLILFISMGLLLNCETNSSKETGATGGDSIKKDTTAVAKEPMLDTAGMIVKNEIKLIPLKGSPEYQDAILQVSNPEQNAKLKNGEVTFNYEVKNYQLKSQTPNPSCAHCNNSKDGQHIHLILNNEPYIAVYTPEFKDTLKDGHYVALSFLSRSYHESIKQFQAFDLRQFTIGNAKTKPVDLTQPLLFYSRPKGEYVGEFSKNILLDFYLANTDLSATGNKVKVDINGNEFIIDKWQPYVIQGLPMGESKVKIELIDKDGKAINPSLNKIERKITLKDQAM